MPVNVLQNIKNPMNKLNVPFPTPVRMKQKFLEMHGILKVEPIIISPKTTKKKSSEIIPGMFKISGLVKADIKFIVEYIDKKI